MNKEKTTDFETQLVKYFVENRRDDLLAMNGSFAVNFKENEIFDKILNNAELQTRSIIYNCLKMSLKEIKPKKNLDNLKLILHIPTNVRMGDIKAEKHENKIITFNSDIVATDEIESITKKSLYMCNICDDIIEVRKKLINSKCEQCNNGKYEWEKNLKTESIQRIEIKERNDEMDGMYEKLFSAEVRGDEVGDIVIGERKRITGIFRSIPIKKKTTHKETRNTLYIDIINIESMEDEKKVMPTDELMGKLKNASDNDTLRDLLIDSYAYHIEGHRDERLACVLALLGGNKTKHARGKIHVLLIGAGSTSKSQTAKFALTVANKSLYTTGSGSTKVGLGAGYAESSLTGKRIFTMGPLTLCNGGYVVIDELDKILKDDISVLHEVMEDQTCSRAVAGKTITLSADVGIIACANPVGGQWDTDLDIKIMDQIPFPPPIVTRFDLKFKYVIEKDEAKNRRILQHKRKIKRDGRPIDTLSGEELTMTLNYMRSLNPVLPEESEKKIEDFYVQLLKIAGEGNIPIDQRQDDALIRISEAMAKSDMCEIISEKHVDDAIALYRRSLESFDMTLEESKMTDAMLHKQYKLKPADIIKQVFNKLKGDDGKVLKENLRVALMETNYFEGESHMQNCLDVLHVRNEIIERDNYYRWV